MDPLQAKSSATQPSLRAWWRFRSDPRPHAAAKPALLTLLLVASVATGVALLVSYGIHDAARQLLAGLLGILIGAVGYKALDRIERNREDPVRYPLNDLMRSVTLYVLATAILLVQVLSIIVAHGRSLG